MTVKEAILDLVNKLGPEATDDDVLKEVESLAIRSELNAAHDDVDAGRLISQEKLEQESATWSSQYLTG